jgi:DNA replication and repair protein RecF
MNGQGKTSIIESIYYLALTKSFRTSNDNNVILYEKKHFDITSEFISQNFSSKKIRVYFSHFEGKHLFVNKKELLKFSEHIGGVPCVLLTLDDLKLSLGGPQERRRFVDILISQISPVYLDDLKRYRRTVMQRNALFVKDNQNEIENQITVWNKNLVKYGTRLIFQRLKFIEYLNSKLSEYYNAISSSNDKINSQYKSSLTEEIKNLSDLESITDIFERNLRLIYKHECDRKVTLMGPHRDDIYFFKNGKTFREYGSQGENKTLVIALKFIEWEYISKERHIKPILLLDDIFGELDEQRLQSLLKFLEKIGQAFITTTMQDKFGEHFSSTNYILKDRKIYDA